MRSVTYISYKNCKVFHIFDVMSLTYAFLKDGASRFTIPRFRLHGL